MLKRTITGALLVAVVVGFFFLRSLNNVWFHILISFIALLGNYEINKMMGDKTSIVQKVASFLGALSLCIVFGFYKIPGAIVTAVVVLIVLFFLPVFSKGKWNTESLALSILSFIYPAVLLVPMMATNYLGDIALFALILTFIISPCADVFAYLVGRTLKGPKLCPEISPNKTISGAIGGLIGGIVGAVVVYAIMRGSFVYHLSIPDFLYFSIVGLVASVLTETGDLVESLLKRNFGVKDSGIIFPGHGGMLDRVDGLIFASIFIYFVTSLI